MARIAVRDGITHMIATPHCLDGVHDCRAVDILKCSAQFSLELVNAGIPLRVYPGAEIRLVPEILDLLAQKQLLTLGGLGKSLLIELPEQFVEEWIWNTLCQLLSSGLHIIIAHPERNMVLEQNPTFVKNLIRMGVEFQLTASSLPGRFESFMKQSFVLDLLTSKSVSYIASDAHDATQRKPLLHKGYKRIASILGSSFAEEMAASSFDLIGK
ncbi:related to capsular polysaccharide biosynthesis protein [Desulfotalea psychrophila LSv54]|uniref:protein-tyrosine-phosphatase n=2 Tax=Desulfotalea psychrophila TaxID=84980 RepID=Q6AI93_DESPS|nr:related to capsular polysaccharide biosynthesis protein [Desulfotalea psychrophila LSv54]